MANAIAVGSVSDKTVLAVGLDAFVLEALAQSTFVAGSEEITFQACEPDAENIDVGRYTLGAIVESNDHKFVIERVLAPLRRRGVAGPVLVVSDACNPLSECLLLRNGVADVVDLGRGIDVIVQRLLKALEIAGLLRGARMSGEVDGRDPGAELRIDGGSYYAEWQGERIDLTPSELAVVSLLFNNPGSFLKHRQIYDVVQRPGFHAGDGTDGFKSNVRASIKRIRQKFRAVDSGFDRIEALAGVGYRWRAEA